MFISTNKFLLQIYYIVNVKTTYGTNLLQSLLIFLLKPLSNKVAV